MAAKRLVVLQPSVADIVALRQESFEKNRREAHGYLETAHGLHRRNSPASVVYNVATIAAEHFLVAICDHYGAPPPGCSLSELVDEVEALVSLDPKLLAELRAADAAYDICSLDTRLGNPEAGDALGMLTMADRLAELVEAAARSKPGGRVAEGPVDGTAGGTGER